MASMVGSNERLYGIGKLQYNGGTLDQFDHSAIDELWQYSIPTLPLSPQYSTTEPSTPGTTPEDGSDTVQQYQMEYEQEMFAEAERALTNDTQPSSQQEDLLLQDCMWNTVITNDTPPNSPEAASEDPEPNYVDPSTIFPPLKNERTQALHISCTTKTTNTRSTPCRSESEEEIVTVETALPEQNQKSKVTKPHLSSTKKGKYSKKKRSRHSSRPRGGINRSEVQRASHNNLERKRRIDIKNSINILRMRIPDLNCKEMQRVPVPKLVILRKAVDYISQLKLNQKRMDEEYNRQSLQYRGLMERLEKLKLA